MDATLLSLARTAAEHWPATLALAGAAWAAFKAARFAKSDADASTLRALHAMPADAFAGKVVLLVGASSGIGEALALALAARGATLILCARRVDRLVDVARRCMEAGAPDAVAQKLDVTDFDSHKATLDSLVRRFGRVDVLVNNAGASQRALASETPLSVDREMFTLNVFGVMSVTRAVLPHMLAAGRGHIVTTSSVAGKTGSPISASYAATKHALQGWFDSLRMEVGYRGIDVTNVCPGPVISEITQHAFTAQPGKRLGEPVKDAEHRLTAERCAELMAGAMWARLPEAWIAPQPILAYVYVRQYAPSVFFAMGRSAGQRRVEAFARGDSGYGSLASVAAVAAGSRSAPAAKTD